MINYGLLWAGIPDKRLAESSIITISSSILLSSSTCVRGDRQNEHIDMIDKILYM